MFPFSLFENNLKIFLKKLSIFIECLCWWFWTKYNYHSNVKNDNLFSSVLYSFVFHRLFYTFFFFYQFVRMFSTNFCLMFSILFIMFCIAPLSMLDVCETKFLCCDAENSQKTNNSTISMFFVNLNVYLV